ncbi:MAG: twin-arginine translocase TatA/TatE family subunit [Bacteroidales bacterium]|nr:twin-arginine translocase TatA/TatE family subunit [Bacteroidales bacterium]
MLAVSLFISGSEIFIILLVVLLLFGANKLPEIARGLGKGMNEFKRATRDIRSEFDEQTKDIQKDVKELKKDVEDQTRFNMNEDFFDEPDQTADTSQTGSGKDPAHEDQTADHDEPSNQELKKEDTEEQEQRGSETDHASPDEPRAPDDPYGLNQDERRDQEDESSKQ